MISRLEFYSNSPTQIRLVYSGYFGYFRLTKEIDLRFFLQSLYFTLSPPEGADSTSTGYPILRFSPEIFQCPPMSVVDRFLLPKDRILTFFDLRRLSPSLLELSTGTKVYSSVDQSWN